ncbi:hypothetical protein PV05_01940 [Exophiala xenobiotica]|uniref:Uncharacterized protein n=1 Tax=Exophiala xenobiotica TaxID=348802 RepID=A0A0D2FPF2_9EURO|nr:uncharacterized protein PV05_01940 [Exophiala xenobiotica]KIW61869.1 hypothetical protein PV05_01940 [Exophiala xenobiotica]
MASLRRSSKPSEQIHIEPCFDRQERWTTYEDDGETLRGGRLPAVNLHCCRWKWCRSRLSGERACQRGSKFWNQQRLWNSQWAPFVLHNLVLSCNATARLLLLGCRD